MEKEKLESLLIDYIDNKLNDVDKRVIEQELMKNQDAFRLYEELKEVMHLMDRSPRIEPSVKMKNDFEVSLNKEIATQPKAKTVLFTPLFYRVAAAIVFFVVSAGVIFLLRQQNDLNEIKEIVKSQEAELKLTRQMMSMLANNESASQRIQGVNVALQMERPDDKIVDALAKTMNEDPNSNVRLAALEALSHFINETQVRKLLIESLAKQKDPIVQISLIQLLVKMKEKTVVDDLQKIVDDEGTIQAVKDEAYSGILKLS